MKRFHQLTADQREKAVEYALTELKSCIKMGLIKFDKVVRQDNLRKHAEGAAQDAWYGELGDMVIDGVTEVNHEERQIH